ncbi:MAG: methanogenesis marker protein Mmp4/MtxX, partial [Promethearchaeota archaeon]
EHNIKILNASLHFLEINISKIYIFGKNTSIKHLSNDLNYKKHKSNIILVECKEPEKEIFEFLNTNTINSIVRGSLSSSKFLNMVKRNFNIPCINRLALLETFKGFQFFYGPVGIDECNNFNKKISFIKSAIKILNSLQIKPILSVLSGGRIGDLGRDSQVDETINIANHVVEYFQKESPDLAVSHDEILIENAIKKKSNLIVAPDGISGNLIYRTLVHLGGGKAYGAIYMDLNKTIIDTSRVGNQSEILGALLLSLALAS